MTGVSDADRLADLEARFAFLDDQVQTLDGIPILERFGSLQEALHLVRAKRRRPMAAMAIIDSIEATGTPARKLLARAKAAWTRTEARRNGVSSRNGQGDGRGVSRKGNGHDPSSSSFAPVLLIWPPALNGRGAADGFLRPAACQPRDG